METKLIKQLILSGSYHDLTSNVWMPRVSPPLCRMPRGRPTVPDCVLTHSHWESRSSLSFPTSSLGTPLVAPTGSLSSVAVGDLCTALRSDLTFGARLSSCHSVQATKTHRDVGCLSWVIFPLKVFGALHHFVTRVVRGGPSTRHVPSLRHQFRNFRWDP